VKALVADVRRRRAVAVVSFMVAWLKRFDLQQLDRGILLNLTCTGVEKKVCGQDRQQSTRGRKREAGEKIHHPSAAVFEIRSSRFDAFAVLKKRKELSERRCMSVTEFGIVSSLMNTREVTLSRCDALFEVFRSTSAGFARCF
jgi:hypothetical protein